MTPEERSEMRRHRSERMTIAAGFNCRDGIVLASDTLYSGVNKRYDRKLWALPTKNGATIALAGSGNAVLIRRARDEIGEQLEAQDATVRQVDARQIVDGVLYSLLHKYKHDAEDFPLSLLVAVRTADGCALYESDGNAVLGKVDKPASCIGWGASLGLYVADFLYASHMSTKWASIVAAHLIGLAKTYAADCGGDTHLLFLPLVGEPALMLDQRTIASLEAHVSELHNAIRLVLPSDAGINDDTLIARFVTLKSTIQRLQHSFSTNAGTDHLGLTGHVPIVSVTNQADTPLTLGSNQSSEDQEDQ